MPPNRPTLGAKLKRKYDALLSQRKGRKISAEVYKQKTDALFAKQIAHNTVITERRRVRDEEKEIEKEHRKLVKKILAQEKRDELRTSLIQKVVIGEDAERSVRDMWKRTVGSRVRIIGEEYINRDGDTERIDITLDVTAGDKGYKSFRAYFLESDNIRVFEDNVMLIVRPSDISASRLFQRFADGVTHCVFTPLISKLASRIEDASKDTAKRIRQRIKKLSLLKVLYAQGIPENKMEEVANVAGIKIALFDVLGNDLAVYNKNGRQGVINMTNTRENHVDIGLVVDSDPQVLNQDAMNTMWSELKKSKKFYMIDGDLKNGLPAKIRTLQGAWQLEDPMRDACNQFDKELGIMNYKIDAMKQPLLNDFLKKGRIINGWSCDIMGGKADGCADMPSAYAQFKKCSMYSGFLGHIHQFRSGVFDRAFVESHIGYYGFRIIGGVSGMMHCLGLRAGMSSVLFSPELLYLMNDGLEVEIVHGAWGSRMDFDFPDYMMTDRRYCNWSGRLSIEREETSHTMSASKLWASHLASDHKVFYWEHEKLVTIKKPVKKCFTAHHILGALTSYVRIQMMDAMKHFKPENLVRVVMDGIYYRGEKPSELDWFKDKPTKNASCETMDWYSHEKINQATPMGHIIGNTLLTGQGGSGKTYSVFNDPGFNNVLFVSPSHILGQDVREKYGANYTTIHKLIGIDCRPYYEENKVPSVILVDEITQLDAEWVEKVFKMYPQSLILLAGDIDADGRWFQCRSGSGSEFNAIWKPHDVDVIEFTEDRRSRDDDLKKLKLRIRKVMKQCDLECGMFQMEEWASNTLPISKFEFAEGDTCIAGTHKTNQKLLDMGVVSGYYKKGGFVSTVELPGYEKRGSYTIHSYQGKTIENGNIWIVIDDLFEYAMLYTAVSRAVNMSQIKFIKKSSLV